MSEPRSLTGCMGTYHSEEQAASPKTMPPRHVNTSRNRDDKNKKNTLWSPVSFRFFPPNPAFPSATSLSLSCLSTSRTVSSSAVAEFSPCSSLTFATTWSTTAWGTESPLSASITRATFERFFFFFFEVGRDGPDSEGVAAGTSPSDSEPDSSSAAQGSASDTGCFSGDLLSSGVLALVEGM